MASKQTPDSSAQTITALASTKLTAQIKQLTHQVNELKAELTIQKQANASLNKELESSLKREQTQQSQTLHQNKAAKSQNSHLTPQTKTPKVSEEKKESNTKPKPRGMIGIIGAGPMGTQLATLLALKTFVILIIDRQKHLLERAKKVHKSICESYLQQKLVTKPAISQCKILYSESVEDIGKYKANMHIIIDTAHDAYKKQVLQTIVPNINKQCMIVSNSFKKCVTELSAMVRGIAPDMAQNLIGINLLYFELSMQNNTCIELIPSWNTSNAIVERCKALVINDLNRQCIVLSDSCAFISNRLNAVYINEAFAILQSKICSAEEIDKIQKLAMINNRNIGPFTLGDRIGLNVIKDILDELYVEYGDKKYVANAMLKQYIRCGKWGRKVGVGVYSYGKQKKKSEKKVPKIQK